MNIRNQPCPCGSGKKYKKCCIKQVDAARELSRIEWEEWFKKDLEKGEINKAEAEAKNGKTVIAEAISECIGKNL